MSTNNPFSGLPKFVVTHPWLEVRRAAVVWIFLMINALGIFAAATAPRDWPMWAAFVFGGPVLLGGTILGLALVGVLVLVSEALLKKMCGLRAREPSAPAKAI